MAVEQFRRSYQIEGLVTAEIKTHAFERASLDDLPSHVTDRYRVEAVMCRLYPDNILLLLFRLHPFIY